MCDYSLHAVKNRPAVVDDKLVVRQFMPLTISKGLATADEPDVAVCLLPGTEVAFDPPVTVRRHTDNVEFTNSTGVFRYLESHGHAVPGAGYRDGFEFPDGETCSIQNLLTGTCITVLQLPAPKIEAKGEEPAPAIEQSRELEPIA